jgi:hypothetical protein
VRVLLHTGGGKVHTHLVQFQVLNRQAFNVAGYTAAWNKYLVSGRALGLKPNLSKFLIDGTIPPDLAEMGLRGTVKSYPGFVTRIRATFTLPSTSTLSIIDGIPTTASGSITATSSNMRKMT